MKRRINRPGLYARLTKKAAINLLAKMINFMKNISKFTDILFTCLAIKIQLKFNRLTKLY